MFQSEVDANGEESRTHDQATDLHFEARVRVGVVVHEEAADVAEGFDDATEDEGDGVGVGAVTVAESELEQGAEDED